MSILRTFLSEFWPLFVVTAVIFPLLWVGRTVSLDRAASLVGPRDFSELSPFPKDEQKRLLQNAHRKAFSGWRLVIPGLLCATLLSISLAASRTLAKVGIIPDSFWMSTGATLLFLGLGGWGLRRLELHRIKRFLVAQMEAKPADSQDIVGSTDAHGQGPPWLPH